MKPCFLLNKMTEGLHLMFQVESKVFVVLHHVQNWIRIKKIIKCFKAESKLILFNIQQILTPSAKTIAVQSIL